MHSSHEVHCAESIHGCGVAVDDAGAAAAKGRTVDSVEGEAPRIAGPCAIFVQQCCRSTPSASIAQPASARIPPWPLGDLSVFTTVRTPASDFNIRQKFRRSSHARTIGAAGITRISRFFLSTPQINGNLPSAVFRGERQDNPPAEPCCHSRCRAGAVPELFTEARLGDREIGEGERQFHPGVLALFVGVFERVGGPVLIDGAGLPSRSKHSSGMMPLSGL